MLFTRRAFQIVAFYLLKRGFKHPRHYKRFIFGPQKCSLKMTHYKASNFEAFFSQKTNFYQLVNRSAIVSPPIKGGDRMFL